MRNHLQIFRMRSQQLRYLYKRFFIIYRRERECSCVCLCVCMRVSKSMLGNKKICMYERELCRCVSCEGRI